MKKEEHFDDAVTTPCPNCAIKHVSAAASIIADAAPVDQNFGSSAEFAETYPYMVLEARAYINLCEFNIGYRRHLGMAIGLLDRAERAAHDVPQLPEAIRKVRIGVMNGHYQEAIKKLGRVVPPYTMAIAHLMEADRELPGCGLMDALEENRMLCYAENDGTDHAYYRLYLHELDKLVNWLDDFATSIRRDYYPLLQDGPGVEQKGEQHEEGREEAGGKVYPWQSVEIRIQDGGDEDGEDDEEGPDKVAREAGRKGKGDKGPEAHQEARKGCEGCARKEGCPFDEAAGRIEKGEAGKEGALIKAYETLAKACDRIMDLVKEVGKCRTM